MWVDFPKCHFQRGFTSHIVIACSARVKKQTKLLCQLPVSEVFTYSLPNKSVPLWQQTYYKSENKIELVLVLLCEFRHEFHIADSLLGRYKILNSLR